MALVAAGILLASVGLSDVAQARTLRLGTFAPSMDTQGFFTVEGLSDIRQWDYTVGLKLRYDDDPLTLRKDGERVGTLVERNPGLHLFGSVALTNWLQIGLSLPMAVGLQGSRDTLETEALDATALGDLRVGIKGIFLREEDHGVSLGLYLEATFPTGSEYNLQSSGGIDFLPSLVLSKRIHTVDDDYVLLSGQFGYRATGEARLGDLTVDDEITWGFGLGYHLGGPNLSILAETTGRTAANDPLGNRAETPVVFQGGLRWWPHPSVALDLGGGLSAPGLGYATPDFRVFLGVAWAPRTRVANDTDGDGITDDLDRCPTDPEDLDDFEDENGCPDLDNDGDGILDKQDTCPNKPEDKDGFEDADGCPDVDNDQDGILDKDDTCLNDPEDKDGFEDGDGCPDVDNDQDGILDKDDACPDKAETMNGFEDADGCPDKGPRVVVTEKAVLVMEKIYFRTDSAELVDTSKDLLDDLARALNEHPEVTKIRVEGHTDSRGTAASNKLLSLRRARAVQRYLVKKGVSRKRLTYKGYGESQPLDTSGTAEAMEKNRRVQFIILKRSDKGAGAAVPAHGTKPQKKTR